MDEKERLALMYSALRVIGYGDWEMMATWLEEHDEPVPVSPSNLAIAVARAASREPLV